MRIINWTSCDSMRIMVSMKAHQLDKQKHEKWIESVGGLTTATLLVARTLKCGFSKAEKVATGRYPSQLPPEELEALADLMAQPTPPKRVVTSPQRKRA